jgi:hypothetical protein
MCPETQKNENKKTGNRFLNVSPSGVDSSYLVLLYKVVDDKLVSVRISEYTFQ